MFVEGAAAYDDTMGPWPCPCAIISLSCFDAVFCTLALLCLRCMSAFVAAMIACCSEDTPGAAAAAEAFALLAGASTLFVFSATFAFAYSANLALEDWPVAVGAPCYVWDASDPAMACLPAELDAWAVFALALD